MRRALRLAAKGFTPPNPMVGCVLVRDNRIVGEGYHEVAGQPHAEAIALRQAGEAAAGATAYVTLEPCSHWGRTPPCADALIRSRVARVVAAVPDTDSRVSGQGLQRLRDAGIQVDTGVMEGEARSLNDAYFHFQSTGTPFVTLKSAATLDGKIATQSGDSRWVTGEAARRYAHRLRAQAGAVLIGVGTALTDNPRLTARLNPRPPRQPLRIIVDSRLRTPDDSEAVRIARASPGETPLLIATTTQAEVRREDALRSEGVEVVRLPADEDGRVDLAALMRHLAQRQIISVLVDGGGEMNAGFIAAKLAHKALFFLAPKIAGGRSAPTAVAGQGVDAMSRAIHLKQLSVRRLGEDFLIAGYFPAPDEICVVESSWTLAIFAELKVGVA
jgi:diaminohydroxyphosphoribosylaminopyrimidine deaminase/5-amino-6-(5-phosphoribosylamino)uracil reductase